MKLRFKLNQAEAFRRGIDAPKSIVHVDVDPATIPGAIREMIADRLDGIDVCQGCLADDGKTARPMKTAISPYGNDFEPRHIEAAEPTLDALIEAVKADQKNLGLEIPGILSGGLPKPAAHLAELTAVIARQK